MNRRGYLKHKEAARALVHERITYYNSFYQVKIGRVSIKNAKTRWGSCSKKGNLNFNYKIIFLPQILADYIVVHELCHLKEFNHSKNFWQHVSLVLPNHRLLKKQLMKLPIQHVISF